MIISHTQEIPLIIFILRVTLRNLPSEKCIGKVLAILFLTSRIRNNPRSFNRKMQKQVGIIYKVKVSTSYKLETINDCQFWSFKCIKLRIKDM